MDNFIDWNTLNLQKNRGTEAIRCPKCDEKRSDKKDKSLKINHNEGYGKCFYCEALTFRDNLKSEVNKYEIPKQEWRNFTNLSDETVKWFRDVRRISQNTLTQFGITEEKIYFPQLQKEESGISFNYFEGDKLVNKKYRTGETKHFTQFKGGKPIFYNINSIVGEEKAYIVEGECFDKNTEVLTQSGWKLITELLDTDLVASVDESKNINFEKPLNYIKKKFEGELIKYSNSKGNFTSLTTPSHNLVYEKKGELKKIKAEDVTTSQLNVPRNGFFDGEGLDISDDLLRLYISISADFTIRKSGDIYGAFKKKRKKERIEQILNRLGLRHSINIDVRGCYSVFIHSKQNLNPFKLFPMEWIGKLSQKQIKLILEEIIFWDGNSVNGRTMKEFNSKEYHNIIFIQTLCHLSGLMSTVVRRQNKFGKWFKATILQKQTSTIKKYYQTKVDYNDYVYCVSVSTGMVLVRQEENITISGNCDVLAMYEAGIKNVISLPNGANDNDNYWVNSEKYLKDIKHFVIATDNDAKGVEVRDKIAQRLGRFRCTYIEWEHKDANDELKHGNISKSIANEKRFPIGGTFTSYDLMDETLKLFKEGIPKTIAPKSEMFGAFNKIFSIMMGQLTVVTGIPSHGKSSFVDWYALNLVNDYDYKLSIFSPEHNPLELYNSKFASLSTGKAFYGNPNNPKKMTDSDLFRYIEWSKEKIYFTSSEEGKTPDWDWLIDKFKEQMMTYGINMFIIDAWNKVQMPKGMSGKEGIDQTLTKLTAFCIQYNVHIFLVAHPTKMKKNEKMNIYEIPDLYDVSGSSDFRNQTHNGLCVYRYFGNEVEEGRTSVINLKTKYDFQGQISGSFDFKWNNDNRRFYVEGSDSYVDFTRVDSVQEELSFNEPISVIDNRLEPNKDWDLSSENVIPDNEVPF